MSSWRRKDRGIAFVTPCDGEFYLAPGRLTRDAKHVFMNGQCHALAIALAERLKRPIYLVLNPCGILNGPTVTNVSTGRIVKAPEEEMALYWDHAVVSLGRGRYLDAEGIKRAKDLVEPAWGRWSQGVLARTTPEQLARICDRSGSVEPNVAGARKFAAVVIRTYLR